MAFEAFLIPHNPKQRLQVEAIPDGETKGFFHFIDGTLLALTVQCEDDGMEATILETDLGKPSEDWEINIESDTLLERTSIVGTADAATPFGHECIIDQKGEKHALIIRHAGRVALESKVYPFGADKPPVLVSPN